MKFTLFALLALLSTSVMAKEVNNFNKFLMDEVKKDIQNDNAEYMKTKPQATRGPASVTAENEGPVEEQSKIDKTVRQIGANKW